jgi:hypothetical protein
MLRARRPAPAEPAAADDTEGAGLLSVVSTSGGRAGEAGAEWTGGGDPTVESLLARAPEAQSEKQQQQQQQKKKKTGGGGGGHAHSSPMYRPGGATGDDGTVFSGFMLKRGFRFGNLLACCPACCGCAPVWKRRFFVMRGGYLFKFASDKRTARPKGTPIPLADAYIDAAAAAATTATGEDGERGEEALAAAAFAGMDLADHRRTIHISTIRKEYTLRAETVARRDEWIRRLRHAKQVAIKVSLGHAKQTKADRDATRAGQRLFKRGIRREMSRAKQTLEMQQMMGSGAGPGGAGF